MSKYDRPKHLDYTNPNTKKNEKKKKMARENGECVAFTNIQSAKSPQYMCACDDNKQYAHIYFFIVCNAMHYTYYKWLAVSCE